MLVPKFRHIAITSHLEKLFSLFVVISTYVLSDSDIIIIIIIKMILFVVIFIDDDDDDDEWNPVRGGISGPPCL
jgi:hypothetical protein